MREVIEFPGLWDLKIPVSREAFKVFNIPIYWYGIIIAFAFYLQFYWLQNRVVNMELILIILLTLYYFLLLHQ
jgi:phosphatidylglycerol:prolipoprotein diacylglycerol transferase